MLCSDVTPLLEVMLDRELDSARDLSVREHLSECEDCRSAWTEMSRFGSRVRDFMGAIKPPEKLRQEIVATLSAASTEESTVVNERPHLALVQETGNELVQRSTLEIAETEQRVIHREALREGTSNTIRHAFRARTIICERHELIRFGLKRVVSEAVEVIGEAADGMTAVEMIRRLRPDFIMLDVDLDVLNGVELCRRVTAELPNANVLVLTDSYHATKYHNQLMRAGARGFCLKSSGPRTLFEAIEQVTRGLPYCDPKIAQLVKQSTATTLPNSELTDREIEVLIRLDLRNKEISEELDMKLRTVEKHIECILAKLKVPTRTAAALKAVQLGLVLLPKMPGRDPVTGVTHEQTVVELQSELAIANEHLKALLKQNDLLKQAFTEKLRPKDPMS